MKQCKYIVADLETVVEDDTAVQQKTAAWSSAWVELFDDDKNVHVDRSIRDTYYNFSTMDCDLVVWYHNLKFDGEFWISFLFSQGYTFKHCKRISKHKMTKLKPYEFDCLVSEMGQMYWIKACLPNGKLLEFRDSLKLIPMSLRDAAKGFKTKYQKLEMDYKNKYVGCPISEKELSYIKNDVLVMKEIMELFLTEGHDKLTIGGCCMSEFKSEYDKLDFAMLFPNLKQYRLNPHIFKDDVDAEEFCRKALRGGWTYLLEKHANKIIKNGWTFDVNSLYPSVMHSDSGNYFPVGSPHFFVGRPPQEAYETHRCFIVEIQCDFDLKEGFLPTVQLKHDYHYDANEYLHTSKIKCKDGSYSAYVLQDGKKVRYRPKFYLSNVDLELFLRHYHVKNLKYISGCWFNSEIGLFDKYINKYFEQKKTSKGAKRQESKLFLNNLWGKFSSSDDSSYKEPYLIDGVLHWTCHNEHEKKVVFVPIGVFVTAYARKFTITAAQANYDNFVYADTDSLHLINTDNQVFGISEHDSDLLCWKRECEWSEGRFLHSKTYIEKHKMTEEEVQISLEEKRKEDKNVSENEIIYDVKCCGMPQNCKNTFLRSSENPILNFKDGLSIDGKLVPKRIEGGQVLVKTYFTIKENFRLSCYK